MKEKTDNIDILEEMIKPIATRTFIFPDGRKEEKEIYNLERKQIEAIENLIAENKELKGKIKEINEEYNAEQKHEMENTIPKSKIEEIMEEFKEVCSYMDKSDNLSKAQISILKKVIKRLQEILGKEKK